MNRDVADLTFPYVRSRLLAGWLCEPSVGMVGVFPPRATDVAERRPYQQKIEISLVTKRIR